MLGYSHVSTLLGGSCFMRVNFTYSINICYQVLNNFALCYGCTSAIISRTKIDKDKDVDDSCCSVLEVKMESCISSTKANSAKKRWI